jgi:hypothetical protein
VAGLFWLFRHIQAASTLHLLVAADAVDRPCPDACRRRGRTLDQDAADALSGLPQEQQMTIAAGFRNFSEQLS